MRHTHRIVAAGTAALLMVTIAACDGESDSPVEIEEMDDEETEG